MSRFYNVARFPDCNFTSWHSADSILTLLVASVTTRNRTWKRALSPEHRFSPVGLVEALDTLKHSPLLDLGPDGFFKESHEAAIITGALITIKRRLREE